MNKNNGSKSRNYKQAGNKRVFRRAARFIKNNPRVIAQAIHQKNKSNIPTHLPFGRGREAIVAELRKLQGLPPVKRYTPRPRQVSRPKVVQQPQGASLKKRLNTHVASVEQKLGSKLTIPIATKEYQGVTQIDIFGFTHFCEHLLAHYAVGDLLTDILPLDFMYYCIYVFFLRLNRLGSLENAPFVNAGVTASGLSVPYALAKYLEYNAPYTKNVKSTVKFYFVDELFGTPTQNIVGTGQHAYPRDDNVFPFWNFFPQSSAHKLAPVGSTTYFPQTVAFDTKADVNLLPFTLWIEVNGNVEAVSAALNKRGNVIPLSQVPMVAPDSSARSRCMSSPSTNFGDSGARSIDDNYDPELTPMFAPVLYIQDGLDDNPGYSNSTQKSMKHPIFTWDNTSVHAYGQIASVCVFIAQNSIVPYKAGKFKDAFPFNGNTLVTYYPQEQPISGHSLSQVVQSVSNQYIEIKSGTSATDPLNQRLTLFAAVSFACLQRRMNFVEVVHYNNLYSVPNPGSIGPSFIMAPQFNYCDGQWGSLNLPPNIATLISSIGPVVNKGVLRIPVSNYNAQLATGAGSGLGGQSWSAYGFTNNTDSYFKSQNIYSTRWGMAKQSSAMAASMPNLVIDNTTIPPTVCNAAYYVNFYGYNSGLNQLYPINPNGGVGTNWQQQFNSWIIASQAAQCPPLVPVTSSLSGDITVMTMTHSWDSDDFVATAINPQAAPGNPTPADPSATGFVQIMNSGPSTVTFPQPTTKVDAAFASINYQGEALQQSGQPPANKVALSRWKTRIITKDVTMSTVDPDQTNIGQSSIDIPWSTGFGALLQNLAQQINSPTQSTWPKDFNSKYSLEAAQRGAKALNSIGGISGAMNLVAQYKQAASETLAQSMNSLPTYPMPARQYTQQVAQVQQYAPAPPPPKMSGWDKFKMIADTGIKVADTATRMASQFADA